MPGSPETILVRTEGRVAVVTLNRPQALNALNAQCMREITTTFAAFDDDPGIGCLLLTGSERAFAAGADIKEMAQQDAVSMAEADWFGGWDAVSRIRTPIVAAVAGHALGGGCELAMMADVLIAAENARFGQPEIRLGVIPGMGGSQRLARAIGKAKAMEMCLTGRTLDAAEAERSGLVSRVVPTDRLMEEALALATAIAHMPRPAARAVKEAINRAFELPLAEGLRAERRLFHALFATEDQKEGMAAFVEKRKPVWRHR